MQVGNKPHVAPNYSTPKGAEPTSAPSSEAPTDLRTSGSRLPEKGTIDARAALQNMAAAGSAEQAAAPSSRSLGKTGFMVALGALALGSMLSPVAANAAGPHFGGGGAHVQNRGQVYGGHQGGEFRPGGNNWGREGGGVNRPFHREGHFGYWGENRLWIEVPIADGGCAVNYNLFNPYTGQPGVIQHFHYDATPFGVVSRFDNLPGCY